MQGKRFAFLPAHALRKQLLLLIQFITCLLLDIKAVCDLESKLNKRIWKGPASEAIEKCFQSVVFRPTL